MISYADVLATANPERVQPVSPQFYPTEYERELACALLAQDKALRDLRENEKFLSDAGMERIELALLPDEDEEVKGAN